MPKKASPPSWRSASRPTRESSEASRGTHREHDAVLHAATLGYEQPAARSGDRFQTDSVTVVAPRRSRSVSPYRPADRGVRPRVIEAVGHDRERRRGASASPYDRHDILRVGGHRGGPDDAELTGRRRDRPCVAPRGRLADPVHIATPVVSAGGARESEQHNEERNAHAFSTRRVRTWFPLACRCDGARLFEGGDRRLSAAASDPTDRAPLPGRRAWRADRPSARWLGLRVLSA